jgi:PKD repeat protein
MAVTGGQANPNPGVTEGAFFTYSAPELKSGVEIGFDASSSYDADGITEWRFNFGDGSPERVATTPLVFQTYLAGGTYNVSLRVKDTLGNLSAPVTHTLVVAQGAGAPPPPPPPPGGAQVNVRPHYEIKPFRRQDFGARITKGTSVVGKLVR